MSGYAQTRGDAQAAVGVMLEAARWLTERGMPLWTRKEIEALPRRYPANAFLTLYQGGQPAAAALLTDADPLFWPQAAPGTSGFLHKLSVRRAFAGTGLSFRLIHYAIQECNKEGRHFLRLDCDASREKLKALYQNAGFAYMGIHRIQTKTHGTVAAALFERAL